MAIAGIEPVDVEVFHVNEDQIETMITGKGVNETTEFYTREQVEELITKFAYRYNANDFNILGLLLEKEKFEVGKFYIGELVSKFMKMES